MTLDQILKEIEKTRKDLKKKYSNWRVKVANAKSITDMMVDSDEVGSEMKWNRFFLDNLREQL
jgi:hypothetical protein